MHTVRTSIVTERDGQITGYGFSIEAETGGETAEILATVEASLEIIRQAISRATQADPPPGYAPAQPPAPSAQASRGVSHTPEVSHTPVSHTPEAPTPPSAPASPPATPREAEQRFFARYGQIVGGISWLDVRAYLGISTPKPRTVDQWIAAAEAVRDRSRQASAQPAS